MHTFRQWMLFGTLFWGAASAGAGPRIISQFALSLEDLSRMTAELPADIRNGILARPSMFLDLLTKVLDQPADLLVLVDKGHPLPADYVPADLVPLTTYALRTTWPNLMLRKCIMPMVLRMVAAAHEEGVTVTFASAYRSYEYQRGLFEREVKLYGRERAERESAQPGYSQHQLGTAIDFGTISDGYENTQEGRWVSEHAWQYGFSLSYPHGYERVTGYRFESWHYRYISVPGALMQREFFDDVQQYFLEFLNDNWAMLEKARLSETSALSGSF
jgi:D-alanyl-D-alanine carboxypeptidase